MEELAAGSLSETFRMPQGSVRYPTLKEIIEVY